MQVPDGTVEHGGCQWAHTPETPRHGHATDREPHSLCSDRLDISFLGTALSSVFLIVSVVEMGIPAHTTPPHSQTPAVSLGLNLCNMSTRELVLMVCEMPCVDWLWQKGVVLISLEHVRPTCC